MSPRERILKAATRLLAEGGREAVSTRSISSSAGVQPPTIYRQFGDMQGLLDAVVSRAYATYLASHRGQPTGQDPVDDLRRGWDLNVDFGLANPALYALMFGNPRAGVPHPTQADLREVLLGLVRRVAEAGRLRIGVERAVDLLYAAGAGVTLALIAQGDAANGGRNPTLSANTREALLAAITTDATDADTASVDPSHAAHGDATRHAVALKASLARDARPFTAAERALFEEWLARFIDTAR